MLLDKSGLGVHTSYGTRDLQDGLVAGGKLPVQGRTEEAVVYIDAKDFLNGAAFVTALTLPAGSSVESVVFETTESFVLSAGGEINIGTEGTEATNGFQITETQAESVGVYRADPQGTWAAALTSDVVVGIALTGTSTGAGAIKAVFTYAKI